MRMGWKEWRDGTYVAGVIFVHAEAKEKEESKANLRQGFSTVVEAEVG